MRHRLLFFAVALTLAWSLWSQPPSPSRSKGDKPLQQPSATNQQYPGDTQRGTKNSPAVVSIAATTQENKSSNDQSNGGWNSTDWWMVRLTGILAVIGIAQTIVFALQAKRLRETIEKMDEISSKQTEDIQKSLTQATLATSAMQGIADSMAASVESVRESVSINKAIADRQKLITELKSRAYLVAYFDGMIPQTGNNFRFQPEIRIENRGNTPAYDIRFSIIADVVPFPVREDFAFALPEEPFGYSSPIGPMLHKIITAVVPKIYPDVEADQIRFSRGQRIIAWGIVKYRDAFKLERFLKFGFTFYQMGDQWRSMDTVRHNESD